VPLALVVAGGPDTLVDALAYIQNGVPLVVANGCIGASAAIAMRHAISVEEKRVASAEGNNAAAMAGLDSLKQECVVLDPLILPATRIPLPSCALVHACLCELVLVGEMIW